MRQFEQYETDLEGNRLYTIGVGDMTPGGVELMYTWTYINPQNSALSYTKKANDERIYLYQQRTVNKEAVGEIVLEMKHTKGELKINDESSALSAIRIGRNRWTHILRFYGYCIGMGDRMYKAVLDAINADEGLKQRLVIA